MAKPIEEAPNLASASNATGFLLRAYREAAVERDNLRQEVERLRARAKKKGTPDSGEPKSVEVLLRLWREQATAANDAREEVETLRKMNESLEGELREAQTEQRRLKDTPIPFNEPQVVSFAGRTLRFTVRARDRNERLQALEFLTDDGKAMLVEITGRDRMGRISEASVLH